jgi:SNF2 family DNA or RNA helicase
MLNESNLRHYQINNTSHILQHPFCGLFVGMGLGKTISSLMAVNTLIYDHFAVAKVLVIAPKRVASSVWPDEIENWQQISHLKISVINGTEKQRIQALNKKADVYAIGRDNVTWLCDQYGSNLPFDMLIVDESSSFKNPQSLRFKALKLSLASFSRIVLLTGTPAPNALIDLWSQMYLLDRGERLGKFITQYRNNYFSANQRNGSIIFNYKLKEKESEQKIYDKISDICISMKSQDYLELPEVLVNDIKVKFPADLQKKYDDFEKEQVLEMIDKEITAVNAAALTNKLLQFSNGAIYDDNRQVHHIHDLKIDACKELIEAAQGQPVLIVWAYQHDRDRLIDALKAYKPVHTLEKKDIDNWNAGKTQVLMMHPASGGHGLNLQFGGHIIIWFGLTWSLELYQQTNARLPRPGQTHRVIINRIVCHDTEDKTVIKALERKDHGQNELLNALKAKIKKYSDKIVC